MLTGNSLLKFNVLLEVGNLQIQKFGSGSTPDPEMLDPAGSGSAPDPLNPPDIRPDPDLDPVHP